MKAFGPAQAQAQVQTQTQPGPMTQHLADGGCALRAVDPAALAVAAAALAEEATRLPAAAARLVRDAAAARFAPAREHVPHYAAWAYDWVQSYVTSYRVLWRLVQGLATATTGPAEPALLDRLGTDMARPMREAFRARVLAPVEAEGRLADDLAHAGAVLDAAWQDAVAAATRHLAGPAMPAPRLDLRAVTAPMAPALAALAPADLLGLMAGGEADTPMIFLRSMRPMAARAGVVAIRVSEAGSILAAGGGFGYALGGLPGATLGLAGGIGLSWGIDWLINRIDATLNQAAFEAQALAGIDAAEARLAGQAEAAVALALAARLAALRPMGQGEGQGCD